MDDNIAKFVGSIPEFYDRGMGPVIFADFAADMAQRVKKYEPKLVVETAAGTGILTRAMRDVLPGRTKIIATDLNPPMLEVARRKFARGEPVVLQPADAMNLGFDDACCDLLVCQFGLMFYPDKDASHREVYRVLEDGGHYLVSVWDSHAHNSFGEAIHKVVGSFFPDDPPQFYAVPFSYSAIDPIKAGLLAAGFSRIDVTVNRIEKVVTDPELFARGTVFGNPMFDQIRGRGGDPEAVMQAILAEFKSRFGTDPMVLQLQEIVFEARKGAPPRH